MYEIMSNFEIKIVTVLKWWDGQFWQKVWLLAEEMDRENIKSQFDQDEHHSSDINCYHLCFTNV